MFCWHCGTRLLPGCEACPFCGDIVCPVEEEELLFEEVGPEFSRLGETPTRLERLLKTPGRRRVARVVLRAGLAVALVMLAVTAWRGVVSGALGSRLRGMNQIVFVGERGTPPSKGARGTTDTVSKMVPAVGELYTIQPDGSHLRPLRPQADVKYFSPAWSPDGAHLAAFAVAADPGYLGTLAVMNADGTDAHLIEQVASFQPASNGLSLFGPPSSRPILWSPDGQKLAATVTNGEFVVVGWDGSALREVTGFLPAWSPDGRSLAYFRLEENHESVRDQLLEVAVWDVQASQPRILANLPMLTSRALAWSPDSQLLAYSGQIPLLKPSGQFLPVSGAVITMHPDGTGTQVLAQWENGLVEQLVWSPDGKQLAVVVNRLTPASDGSGTIQAMHTELWVMNSDGSHARSLGPSAVDAPSWAPDGHRLVFVSAANDWLEIADTMAEPVALKKLTLPQMYVWGPVWSALPGLIGPSS